MDHLKRLFKEKIPFTDNMDEVRTNLVGPKNRELRREFLVALLETLKSHSDTIPENGVFGNFYDRKRFYEPFLSKHPKVVLGDETFVIKTITLTDFAFELRERTYNDAFHECDNSTPSPDVCPCVSCDTDEEEKVSEVHKKKPMILYSLKGALDIPIKYEGEDVSYFSQPHEEDSEAGSQYDFEMTFSYSQENFSIMVDVGPDSCPDVVLTGSSNNSGFFVTKRQDFFSYKPSMLWFGNESLPSIRNALLKKETLWEHNGRTFEIIDKKFCKSNRDDKYCGCCYTWCEPMSEEVGIKKIPDGQSYRRDISISCTPEWYIQYQISCCSDYSYCGRIILKLVAEDMEKVSSVYREIEDFYPWYTL